MPHLGIEPKKLKVFVPIEVMVYLIVNKNKKQRWTKKATVNLILLILGGRLLVISNHLLYQFQLLFGFFDFDIAEP